MRLQKNSVNVLWTQKKEQETDSHCRKLEICVQQFWRPQQFKPQWLMKVTSYYFFYLFFLE
jgi:hypothetical protein